MPQHVTMLEDNDRKTSAPSAIPKWLPRDANSYLQHVCLGLSIRELARRSDCHASTILRQVRKIEAERDDPLKDEALERLSASYLSFAQKSPINTEQEMSSVAAREVIDSDVEVEKEARRILRRLCETHSFLLVSPEMEKAAVFRETVPGRRTRIAVVDREIAQVFALKDWIEGQQSGRVGIYKITNAGKSALKRLLAQDRKNRGSKSPYSEEPDPFREQHQDFGTRNIAEQGNVRKVRYNLAESPLTALSRKKAPDGSPYLLAEHLEAGERLREDFELAQIGPRTTQNWDHFLTASTQGGAADSGTGSDGASRARARVSAALADLGPGLADVVFRCCCFLEGLETAEKRLGWSARAGKVVLRIALGRLSEHYKNSNDSRLIG